MITADVDIRGFSRFVESLQNALIGTGQDGDLFKVVKSEARQLAWEISGQLGPRTAGKGMTSVEKDVRKVFFPGPTVALDSSKQGPDKSFRWLVASPKYLVGVVADDAAHPNPGDEFMERVLRYNQKAKFPRGNAWRTLSTRGKQHVMWLNRVIVTQERYQGLIKRLALRVGRMRATFAFAAAQLGFTGVPAWISRHFANVKADGKAIFRFIREGDTWAIEFGSRAPGVSSNPHIQEKIHGAVEKRKHMLIDKIKKILSGYQYDWNSGAVFKRSRGEEIIKQLDANEAAFNSLP